MKVVIDSNVLFRILITGGEITNLLKDNNLKIFGPKKLQEEFNNNREEILHKSKLPSNEVFRLISLFSKVITFIPKEEYKPFLPQAKQLLKDHNKDEDFIALCLAKNIKLWTYEDLLFKIGFGISTKQISEELSKW